MGDEQQAGERPVKMKVIKHTEVTQLNQGPLILANFCPECKWQPAVCTVYSSSHLPLCCVNWQYGLNKHACAQSLTKVHFSSARKTLHHKDRKTKHPLYRVLRSQLRVNCNFHTRTVLSVWEQMSKVYTLSISTAGYCDKPDTAK